MFVFQLDTENLGEALANLSAGSRRHGGCNARSTLKLLLVQGARQIANVPVGDPATWDIYIDPADNTAFPSCAAAAAKSTLVAF